MQKEVKLQKNAEPLQIPYPKGYRGVKSGRPTESEFHLSTQPRFLSVDEIEVARKFIEKLPYKQSLVTTGCVLIDVDDPLLKKTQPELDAIEKANGFPNSRYAVAGGERQLFERVLILRENGYEGSGADKLLVGV